MKTVCRCHLYGFAAAILVIPLLALAAGVEAAGAGDAKTPADSTMKLQGGDEGTIFKSLRIEGEDRVRIEFDRPALDLSLDPRTAPGLDFEIVLAALDRAGHDLVKPYMDGSALNRGPRFTRPWLDLFTTGSVVRFQPAIEGVEKWRLDVADSRGQTVMSYEGKGKPPKEINWDGRMTDGTPAPPGLRYSYVLEAYDRAGNKRNFVGDGFEIPPYIVMGSHGFAMLFSGSELQRSAVAPNSMMPAPVILEAATRINQSDAYAAPVRIQVTARSFDEAKRTADSIVRDLTPFLLGDPIRLQPVTTVEPDAPDTGTIMIAVGME